MTRERWMALLFLAGAICFVVGPASAYLQAVGASADADTFFVGSIFFTAGGAVQSWLAWSLREHPHDGGALWWSAAIQSVGTALFNVTTYEALTTATSTAGYDNRVWVPNALGSVCFLVSGVIAYRVSPLRDGWIPKRVGPHWWEPVTNFGGCVLFGISAVGSYVTASRGEPILPAVANWNTSLGAVCFLACAGATLISGWTLKSARLRRFRELEQELAALIQR